MRLPPCCFVPALVLLSSASAHAGLTILVTDRDTDSVWLLHDDDNDLVINEATEVTRWFGPGNAAGLPGVLNPNTIGYPEGAVGRVCLIGDQDPTARKVYWTVDLNADGDAMDVGEAGVFGDISGTGGQWFAFPTGLDYDSNGVPYLVNASNASGPDAIWKCADSNADMDVNDAGETTSFVTVNGFGGSGSYSPQEIVIDSSDTMFLRNSSASLHGVWKLFDYSGNGVIDAANEFVLWFGLGNQSGHTPSAGFAVDIDPLRPHALYYHTLMTGGVDQVWRLMDTNGDEDAQDFFEATLVWSTAEAAFTSVDVCALADGSVLVTDNSTKRIIRLKDIDGDGLFTSAGERANLLTNATLALGDVRNIAIVINTPPPPQMCDSIDFNNDGLFPDTLDIDDFLSVFSGGPCSTDPSPGCAEIDFNNDGLFPDTLDIDSLISVFSGGPCL